MTDRTAYREAQRRYIAKLRDSGLVKWEIWATPEHVEAIRKYAEQIGAHQDKAKALQDFG